MNINNVGELSGVVAAILSVGIYIPQLVLILKTKNTRDISLLFLILLILCNLFWAINGYLTHSNSRLFSGLTIIILSIPMLYYKLNDKN